MMEGVSVRGIGSALALALASLSCAIEPVEPVGTTTTTTGADSGGGTLVTTLPPSDTDPMHNLDSSGTAATSTGSGGATGTGTGGGTAGCEVGQEGCPCTASGSCDPGLQCLSQFCVDVGDMCPIGAEGCPCTQGGACDPGLVCASQVCVDPAAGG